MLNNEDELSQFRHARFSSTSEGFE